MKSRAKLAAPTGLGPERWRAEGAGAALLRLEIPPHASRERVFDISCALVVKLREDRADAWHRLAVQADGRREWDHRVQTRNPGATDSLEMHFRRRVPVGEALRLLVTADVNLCQRVSLVIEADEA